MFNLSSINLSIFDAFKDSFHLNM